MLFEYTEFFWRHRDLVYWHATLCRSVRRLSGIRLSFAIVLFSRTYVSAGSLGKKVARLTSGGVRAENK